MPAISGSRHVALPQPYTPIRHAPGRTALRRPSQLDTARVRPDLIPLGKDHGLMWKFIALSLVMNLTAAVSAVIDRFFLIVPLCLIFLCIVGLVYYIAYQMLDDPAS
jgi:hypothetical protein